MSDLTSGTAASRAGVNLETLRYYERRGLLPDPPRSQANYRLYSEDAIRRIRFIKRAQELGFTLVEIKELLMLTESVDAECSDVRQKALAKIRDVELRMRDLKRIKRTLEQLAEQCPGSSALNECPILRALDDGGRDEA
jgi:Hg(II)-responsive transcriptional regulator